MKYPKINTIMNQDSFNGLLLIFMTIIALIIRNSSFNGIYADLLNVTIGFQIEDIVITKPLILWINDGLMTLFFFYIGLEIKREILEGHLSNIKKTILPIVAAIGGIVVPALIYILINDGNEFNLKGWAVPTATDIAFALAILSLLGNRIPVSLKIFLMALAIIDDLGAILIIGLFYTNELNVTALCLSTIFTSILILLNKFNVDKKSFYMTIGVFLWFSVLESGLHPTIAGVIIALTIPLYNKYKIGSMLKSLLKELYFLVYLFILPLFAFANAGIDFSNLEYNSFLNGVSLGIFFGLVLGKPIGVFLFSYIFIKLKIAELPKYSNYKSLFGVSILTGIGFTMSMFINGLAFEETSIFNYTDKLSILIASLLSGIIGYIYLRSVNKNRRKIMKIE